MKLLALPVVVATLACPALLSPALAGEAAEPPLVLQYDFFEVQGGRVVDGSGHGHAGALTASAIVSGKRKPAVQLAGTGMITADALGGGELTGPMTVGAMCKPEAGDGVVASMGDASEGFSLYLKDGIPHFAVRSHGQLHEVADTDAVEIGQWVHLAGVIGRDGSLALLVNAFPAATSAAQAFLGRSPVGPFVVGEHWQGLIEDVRVYGGAVSREAHRDLLGDWANRPGCGCRK